MQETAATAMEDALEIRVESVGGSNGKEIQLACCAKVNQ
jgi:hypothetical protein